MRKFLVVLAALVISMLSLSVFAQQVKIAVVNPQQIIEKSKEGQRIKSFLQTFFDSKQTDINAKETELKALDEKIKDPKIAEDKKEDMRAQFQQKLYEAQAFAKAAQDEMDQKSGKMKEEFGVKLDEVVKKYATSKGISIVLEKGITLYSADAMDVTTEIIAEMDKAYPGK
ncbi:MAG TPA: OmpH family outer membrane protein [Acidobacteriota bacterium]|mgnify:FL=1|jgi:outer membrane protein|nr:OmpH family outer membrane protein [Acidobacteriota bacterium]HNT16986.1 OmpH family outer membrane protein [Acidobacteriota bacterium]HPA26776.1 OmpH family outer membrane protein [Acidobacteriota bacterium]HQO20604.1 OmpH family outer membrane protein [Acidobacteriota bacterium]HQQ47453.1 OmpH family outer membrane protein [Acidobacteriota bacterium]